MSSEKSARSEYENVYLMDNPMYQAFSVLLTDDDGNNICNHIGRLTSAIERNNQLLGEFLVRKQPKAELKAEPKAAEPKTTEPKAAEPKAAEPKAEPKAAEPKAAEPKAERERKKHRVVKVSPNS